MQRSENRILTSHSGSMFPPPDDGDGEGPAYFAATATETRTEQDQIKQAVRAIVDKQVEVGLDVINNGDQNIGVTLVTFPRMFDGLEQRPPEGRANVCAPALSLQRASTCSSGISRRSRQRPRGRMSRICSTASSRPPG